MVSDSSCILSPIYKSMEGLLRYYKLFCHACGSNRLLGCMFDLLRCYGGFSSQGLPCTNTSQSCDTEALWTAAAEANRVNTVRTEWLNTLVSFSSSGNVMDKSRCRSFFSADICLHRLSLCRARSRKSAISSEVLS